MVYTNEKYAIEKYKNEKNVNQKYSKWKKYTNEGHTIEKKYKIERKYYYYYHFILCW